MTEKLRSSRLRNDKDLRRYQETETVFMSAKKDIRRLVVDAPGFLPEGKTDIGRVLDKTLLMTTPEYVQHSAKLLMSNGIPEEVVQHILGPESVHTTSFASTNSVVATGTEKIITVNADKMRGESKTFFVQVLLEELAHAYSLEEKLGSLQDMPQDSSQYFPLSTKAEILQWIRIPRNTMRISGSLAQQKIDVHRVGCQLLFEETAHQTSTGHRRFLYGMPSGHQALEETRASIIQAIFMAKYLGGHGPGTAYDKVVAGLSKMDEGGWVDMHRRGYRQQALGFGMVVPVVMAMANNRDPAIDLSGRIGRLHDMNYDELRTSDYAQAQSGNFFDHSINYFADTDPA